MSLALNHLRTCCRLSTRIPCFRAFVHSSAAQLKGTPDPAAPPKKHRKTEVAVTFVREGLPHAGLVPISERSNRIDKERLAKAQEKARIRRLRRRQEKALKVARVEHPPKAVISYLKSISGHDVVGPVDSSGVCRQSKISDLLGGVRGH